MHKHFTIFAYILICLFMSNDLFAQNGHVDAPPTSEASFGDWVRSFSILTDSQLDELILDDNQTVALNAAWELVVRDRMQNKDHFEQFGPKKKVSWFLGILEAKCSVKPPKDWKNLFEEAQIHSTHIRPVENVMAKCEYKSSNGSYYSPNLGVTRNGDKVTVVKDNKSIEVVIPPKSSVLPSFLSGQLLEDVFVFGFHEGYPTDFDLQCYDSSTDKLIWNSEVWSVIRVTFSSGSGGFHHVSFAKGKESIWVFGITSDGIYCQAHNLENGDCTARFYSAFFNDRK